ncbi:MAG: hypothetical protein KAH21_11340, partial [Spirochaetaceae bacterium]|nr:hypothetical protein [Spirochaetaceae bacterium]
MKSRFFSFISPALKVIDNGKFFREPLRWLYFFLGALNLLIPLALIVTAAVYSEFLFENVLYVLGFVLFFSAVCFTSWLGFQIWWNRADTIRLYSSEGDENFATVAFSHFIQTSGEWLGVTVALNGFFTGLFVLLGMLISMIFYGVAFLEVIDIVFYFGVNYLGRFLFFTMLLAPLSGFLILVTTRFLAEQIRALASVANYS